MENLAGRVDCFQGVFTKPLESGLNYLWGVGKVLVSLLAKQQETD